MRKLIPWITASCTCVLLAGCGGKSLVTGPPTTPAAPGYVIGTDDVLNIVFWRDEMMSGDVVVRPDGKISVPLLNDVEAAGRTPEELRADLVAAASRIMAEPNATVVVKQINSRKVFITGNVRQPGSHPLIGQMTVLQLIALAGGLDEYADSDNILIVRAHDNGEYLKFNYGDVLDEKHVEQNVALRPGDTVVVP